MTRVCTPTPASIASEETASAMAATVTADTQLSVPANSTNRLVACSAPNCRAYARPLRPSESTLSAYCATNSLVPSVESPSIISNSHPASVFCMAGKFACTSGRQLRVQMTMLTSLNDEGAGSLFIFIFTYFLAKTHRAKPTPPFEFIEPVTSARAAGDATCIHPSGGFLKNSSSCSSNLGSPVSSLQLSLSYSHSTLYKPLLSCVTIGSPLPIGTEMQAMPPGLSVFQKALSTASCVWGSRSVLASSLLLARSKALPATVLDGRSYPICSSVEIHMTASYVSAGRSSVRTSPAKTGTFAMAGSHSSGYLFLTCSGRMISTASRRTP